MTVKDSEIITKIVNESDWSDFNARNMPRTFATDCAMKAIEAFREEQIKGVNTRIADTEKKIDVLLEEHQVLEADKLFTELSKLRFTLAIFGESKP